MKFPFVVSKEESSINQQKKLLPQAAREASRKQLDIVKRFQKSARPAR